MLFETLSPETDHKMQTLHLADEVFTREKARVEVNSSSAELTDPDITALAPERSNTEPLHALQGLVKDGYDVILLSENEKSIETLGSKLAQLDFNPVVDTDLPIKEASGISIISGVDIARSNFP